MTDEYRLIEQHEFTFFDRYQQKRVVIPVRAGNREKSGPEIEIGHYSMMPEEAWMLAQSLLILAAQADPKYLDEPVHDPVQFQDGMRRLDTEGSAE